jgi:hypothetical protein
MLATAAALASFVLTSNMIARRLRPRHGNLPQPPHPTSSGTSSLPGAIEPTADTWASRPVVMNRYVTEGRARRCHAGRGGHLPPVAGGQHPARA